MSGHNKWSQIKHKKAATDAQKSRVFGKLARFIADESKRARGDTSAPGLRAAIEKAKSLNMPSDNVTRAVKKGTGTDAGEMNRVVYEAYGPGGCAIIINGLTDNRNRTSQEIKHLLSKNGGVLASPGSASWAFEKTLEGWLPQTHVSLSEEDNGSLLVIVEELEENDDVQGVYTNAI